MPGIGDVMESECTASDVLRWHAYCCTAIVAVFGTLAVTVDPIWWWVTVLVTGSGTASALLSRWIR